VLAERGPKAESLDAHEQAPNMVALWPSGGHRSLSAAQVKIELVDRGELGLAKGCTWILLESGHGWAAACVTVELVRLARADVCSYNLSVMCTATLL
jgi:hypothetical protein